jgi:hypothetical protein
VCKREVQQKRKKKGSSHGMMASRPSCLEQRESTGKKDEESWKKGRNCQVNGHNSQGGKAEEMR